jgi:alanine racemase
VLRPAWLEINLSALADNIHNLKSVLSPHQQIIAVVKGDAYGHGAVPVSRVALRSGASRLAVALVQEALELRQDGCAAPILILSATPREAAPLLVEQQIEAPVTDLGGAQALSRAAQRLGRPALAHLKIDTGLHRLGLLPEEVPGLCAELRGLPGLEIIGIFTHFSSAPTDPEYTMEQFTAFREAVRLAEEALGHRIAVRHACNSAATVRYPEAWLDAVRPGALIYGIPRNRGGLYMPVMRPVLSLHARLAVVKTVCAGDYVGYDRSWQAPYDCRLGLLPIGYGDGYDRRLSNRGEVLLHGHRCPIVGRVCMDTTIVDLTPAPEAQVEDLVTLVGEQGEAQIQVHDLAEQCDSIEHEIVSRFSSRLPRVYYAEPGDTRVRAALADKEGLLSDAPIRHRAGTSQYR